MYEKNLGVVFLCKNKSFVDELCSYAEDARIVPLSLISNLKNLEASLKCLQPELIVIDDSFAEITGARLLQKLKAFQLYTMPLIIILSVKTNPEYVELCYSAGVNYFMAKPFMADVFWERAVMLFNERQLQDAEARIQSRMEGGMSREEEINRETMKLLYRLGCHPKEKGFLYLKEAVAFVAKNQTRIHMRSRNLYEVIGSKFQQSWLNVQRNIAIAIKSINIELIKEFLTETELEFMNNNKMFTSMEFISLAAYLVCENVDRSKEDKCYEQ